MKSKKSAKSSVLKGGHCAMPLLLEIYAPLKTFWAENFSENKDRFHVQTPF